LMIIYLFENQKLQVAATSLTWTLTGFFAYTVFAIYVGWFGTFLLPRQYKRHNVLFYLQRRATDIALAISFVIMDLINKSNSGDANDRDRSDADLANICLKIDPYQSFDAHLERDESYVDFYEYFSSVAGYMNSIIERLLTFSDVLTPAEIQILLRMEKETNSPMTRNIKFSSGMIDGKPAPATIPDSYAYVINRLRRDSKTLLDSFEIGNSVT
jgi:hypothetical protein